MAKITVKDLANKLKKTPEEILKTLEGTGVYLPGPDSEMKAQEISDVVFKYTGKRPGVKKAEPQEEKKEAKADVKAEAKSEVKAEVKPEAKTETKPVTKAEVKSEAKPETKSEVKPPVKADAKPQNQTQTARPQGQNGDRQQRPYNSNGQNGTRQARPYTANGQNGARPQGQNGDRRERQYNQNGQNGARTQGQNGDRPQRPYNPNGQNGNRPQGQGSRPMGQNGARPMGPRMGQGARPQGVSGGFGAVDSATSANANAKASRGARKNNNSKDKARVNSTEERTRRRQNVASFSAAVFDEDGLAIHKKKKPTKKPQTAQVVEEVDDIKLVTLPETITVKDFAEAMHKPMPEIIKALMAKGILASMNQPISFEQAQSVAEDMDILVEHQAAEDVFANLSKQSEELGKADNLPNRAPVVVVMGHVDHGKTSLLDAIRDTRVTEGEAGGITQHIGASIVKINGRPITFLDTPGHEAFTAMRLRGAMVTDIAILVVAADDGVMPQTIEAINHAKAAGVQIIVAINKMDKQGANPDRIKQELAEHEVLVEEWGGDTPCIPVSAKKREGIKELLEMVLLEADVLDLRANPDCLATGTIIESELDKGRGAVATMLIQQGTLHIGDYVVSGSTYGRVRAMLDDKGGRIKEAGPSMAVEITGLSGVPEAGEAIYSTETESEARTLAERVTAQNRVRMNGGDGINLNNLFDNIKSGDLKTLNLIVKADVQGSVEAVKQSLEKLSNEEVTIKVLHGAVGAINESDVMLASTSGAIIIGFNVRPEATAKASAESSKVDIRLYRVIYTAIEEIQAAMKGMLAPKYQEKELGKAEIRQVFKASGIGTVAGSYVTEGKITRSSKARLVRDGIVVWDGEVDSIRRVKDDVKEIAAGYECGIKLANFTDIKEGDIIEAYIMEEVTAQ